MIDTSHSMRGTKLLLAHQKETKKSAGSCAEPSFPSVPFCGRSGSGAPDKSCRFDARPREREASWSAAANAVRRRFGSYSRFPCAERRIRNGVKAPSTPARRALPAHSKTHRPTYAPRPTRSVLQAPSPRRLRDYGGPRCVRRLTALQRPRYGQTHQTANA
jgi:hypothetical protein